MVPMLRRLFPFAFVIAVLALPSTAEAGRPARAAWLVVTFTVTDSSGVQSDLTWRFDPTKRNQVIEVPQTRTSPWVCSAKARLELQSGSAFFDVPCRHPSGVQLVAGISILTEHRYVMNTQNVTLADGSKLELLLVAAIK